MMIPRKSIDSFYSLFLVILYYSSFISCNQTLNNIIRDESTPQIFMSIFHVSLDPLQQKRSDITDDNGVYLNFNTLLTNPIDVKINVDDMCKFKIFFREPLLEQVQISFKCQGGCTTFENKLKPVVLSPNNNSVFVEFYPTTAGHDVIEMSISGNTSYVDMGQAFLRLRVGRSDFLNTISSIFGWLYFFGWSISFWPQNVTNFKRKSVVGLSFDYTILHFTGFIFYSIFNCVLYWSAHVQIEYEERHPRSEIPVQLNDVVYALHAVLSTSITWYQCMFYESGNQRLSLPSKLFQCLIWIIGTGLAITAMLNITKWIDFIYYFSYVKLFVTSIKYLPQLFFNFRRKSTKGWSIWMIYLDFFGGFMSMLQMLILSFNFNDWQILIGNFPKLGLAIASMLYDVLFLLQEYVFYPGTSRGPSLDDSKKMSIASIESGLKNGSTRNNSKVSIGHYPTYGTENNNNDESYFKTKNYCNGNKMKNDVKLLM